MSSGGFWWVLMDSGDFYYIIMSSVESLGFW